MRRSSPALLLAAFLLVASAALAQTAESVIADFGLFATWAADCSKPAAKDNIYSKYMVKDGQVLNVLDAGPTFFEDTMVVRSAKATGIDLLLMQLINKAGQETLLTLRRIGDKMQVWRVVSPDGSAPVHDGKYVANDSPIPALSKCN